MKQLTDSQREALAAVLEAAKRDWDDYRAHIQDGLDYPGRVVPLVEDFAEVSARWKAHFAEVEAMLAAEPAHQAELDYSGENFADVAARIRNFAEVKGGPK